MGWELKGNPKRKAPPPCGKRAYAGFSFSPKKSVEVSIRVRLPATPRGPVGEHVV